MLFVALPDDASANPRKFCATAKKSLKEHPTHFLEKNNACARVWSSGLRSEQYPKYQAKCPEVMKKHFPASLVRQCEGMKSPTTPVCTKIYQAYTEQVQVVGSAYDGITPTIHVGNGTGPFPKGTLISDEDLACIQKHVVARGKDVNLADTQNKIKAFKASVAGWHEKWKNDVKPFIAISKRACTKLESDGISCISLRSGKYPETPRNYKAYLSTLYDSSKGLSDLKPSLEACKIAQDLQAKERSWTPKASMNGWKHYCTIVGKIQTKKIAEAEKRRKAEEEERIRLAEEERLRKEEERLRKEEERIRLEEEERLRKEEEEQLRKEEAERLKKEAAEKKRTAAAKSALCKANKECIESLSYGPDHEDTKYSDIHLFRTVRCLLGVEGGPWCGDRLLPDTGAAGGSGPGQYGEKMISELEALLPILKIRHYQKLLKISTEERDACLVGGGRFVNKDRGACNALYNHLVQLGPVLQLRECLAKNGKDCSYKSSFPRTTPKSIVLKNTIKACSAAPTEIEPCDNLLKYVETLSKSSSCTNYIPEFRTNNGSSSFRYARVPSLPISSSTIRTSSSGARKSRYLVNMDIGLRWTYDPQMPYQVSSLNKTLDMLCREHPDEALARDACSKHQNLKKNKNYIGQECKKSASKYIKQQGQYATDRYNNCRTNANNKAKRWNERCVQHRNSYYGKSRTCTQQLGQKPTSSHCTQKKDAVTSRSSAMKNAAYCLDNNIKTIDRLGNVCLSLQKRRTTGSVAACYEMAYKMKCSDAVVWE